MKAKLWGVRGSIPSPLTPEMIQRRIQSLLERFIEGGGRDKSQIKAFLDTLAPRDFGGYGGNTTCVEVTAGSTQMIIDAGSGLRPLGYELLKGPAGKGQGEIHIFFTHFHWDHLIGLPFFTPIFIPGNKIHFHSVQLELSEVIETTFSKPYFPVELQSLGTKLEYHHLKPREPFQYGDLRITPYQLDHPDPTWGYKIEHGGKTLAYCVDTEATRSSREALGADLPLYQNIDTMIFDSQYTLMESIEKVNWGHASAPLGLDLAIREGIRRVVFTHHEPAASDEKIALAAEQARQYYEGQLKVARRNHDPFNEVEWSYATEGMILDI